MTRQIVGGGHKKVLYTLNTIRQIGVTRAAKALNSRNTCKSCALGMGGQMGGMVNEAGEYPAVCNKSVQAQSTDIQPPIPTELFTKHTLEDFKDLTGREMEKLGRLNTPLYKAKSSQKYTPISWDEALHIAIERLNATPPDQSFFYSSGRSSNEAGFLFQLIARLYGTNNVTNCSYFCHQATGVALGNAIGTGTSTVELDDLNGCDLIFVIGANPASNHPRFIHKLKACRDRGGHVVVINPAREPGLVKFALPKSPKSMLKGGDEIASHYLQPRIGEDIALFKGIAKGLLELGATDTNFIGAHTDGFENFKKDIETTPWEEITKRAGISKTEIMKVAKLYASSKSAVFAWGMGITHHKHGVENIEQIANLALMRAMIGRPNAGLLPLRGHSNVQGIGTIGVKPVLPEDILANIENNLGVSLPKTKGLDTMASIAAAYNGNVRAAVFMGGNIYAATPNTKWCEQALNNIGFKLYLTTTLNTGHMHGQDDGETLVLPVTARDEEWEPTTQESMFNFVRLSDGGISRLENVKPESVILSQLGAGIVDTDKIDFTAFSRHRELRKAIADCIPGMEEMSDIEVAKREFHIKNRLLHTPDFKLPGGKARFTTTAFPDQKGAPFTLSTIRSEGQYNSIIYEEHDSYRGTKNRWSILMNSDDMKRLGISTDTKATVKSNDGVMEDVTVYPFDLPSGSIMAYYPEANILAGTDIDPRSKTPAFKSIPVDISLGA